MRSLKVLLDDFDLGLLAIQIMPERYSILDLSKQEGYNRTLTQWKKIFQVIPKHVHGLDISFNHLYAMSLEGWQALMAMLPSHITHLNLANNQLSNLSVLEFTKFTRFICAVPPSVIDLCLNWNGLHHYTFIQLRQIFEAREGALTSIGLAGNHFKMDNISGYHQMLFAMGHKLASLDFSHAPVEILPVAKLIEFVSGLPSTIHQLLLGQICLGLRPNEELKALLTTLTLPITHLSLDGNFFGMKPHTEVCETLACLSQPLELLDLSDNHWPSIDYLEGLLTSLPDRFKVIRLSVGEFKNELSVKALGDRLLKVNRRIEFNEALGPFTREVAHYCQTQPRHAFLELTKCSSSTLFWRTVSAKGKDERACCLNRAVAHHIFSFL